MPGQSISNAPCYRPQKLFSDIPGIYTSTREDPNVIRIRVRMQDNIEPECLRYAADVIQRFSDDALVKALLAEFEGNGIECHLQDVQPLNLPNVRLPWTV